MATSQMSGIQNRQPSNICYFMQIHLCHICVLVCFFLQTCSIIIEWKSTALNFLKIGKWAVQDVALLSGLLPLMTQAQVNKNNNDWMFPWILPSEWLPLIFHFHFLWKGFILGHIQEGLKQLRNWIDTPCNFVTYY